MPKGTANTDPRDRRVIIVASREDLIHCAARASASGLFEAALKLTLPAMAAAGGVAISVSSFAFSFGLKKMSDADILKELESGLRLGVPVALFGPSDAIRLFKFGVGHTPKSGCVYVQHPILPDTYIPPEDFARTLAREKEAAFRQLASALGAKELRLVSAKVQSKKGFFGSTVTVPEAASQVGVKIAFDSAGSFIKTVYSKFGPPRSPPRIPDDLRAWVEVDPDLRTMARDRTEGHLLENQITLEFKEGVGAGADVATALWGRGMTAGGAYEALYHSVWHFEAEYWPLDLQ
jgi:hypothetical protein